MPPTQGGHLVSTVTEARRKPKAVLGFDPPAQAQMEPWDSVTDRLRSPLNVLAPRGRAPDSFRGRRHVGLGDAEGAERAPLDGTLIIEHSAIEFRADPVIMQFARYSTADIIGILWGAYFAKCAGDYGWTERSSTSTAGG